MAVSSPKGVQAPSYRTDIDGLRAVAVLFVLFFHLHLSEVSGGFIGVDIFFVISGYLISGIIYREMKAGRFSFARFYERRVRRIAPALFVVLSFSTAISYWLLLPRELVKFSHSLLAAILSCSNFYFWTQSGYFNQDFGKVLLHTWSLSVEEQFYLILPVALYLIHKRARTVFPFLVAAILASFAAAEWMVLRGDTVAAFYSPLSRAWELLLGSAIAVLPELPHIKRPAREILAATGLLMILFCGLRFSVQTPFPGAAALLPCVGAALLILTGRDGTLVSWTLSTRPMVFVGAISYSLYLWHWPLVIMVERGAINGLTLETPAGKLAVIAVSLVLGWLSWLLIEQPFRKGPLKGMPRNRLFIVAGASGLALGLVAVVFASTEGFPGRFSARAVDIASYADPDSVAGKHTNACQLSLPTPAKEFKDSCIAQDPSRRNILLLGDSHAGALWFGLVQSLPNDHIMEASVTSGCVFIVGNYDDSLCGQMRRRIYEDYLPRHSVDLVVLTQRWNRKVNAETFEQTFLWLKEHHFQVAVVGPVPEYDAPLPLLLASSMKNNSVGDVSAHLLIKSRMEDQELQESAARFHYEYISPYQTICGGGSCKVFPPTNSSVPMLKDTDHLTNAAAIWLVGQWANQHLLN